jgi:hypothetical protein
MRSDTIEQMLGMLDKTPEELERFQSRMTRLRIAYAALALPAFLALDAYLASRLWTAWHTHDWSSFWDDMRWGWTLLPFVGLGSAFYEVGRQAGQARVLHAAVTQQTARREVPPESQPEPLAGRDLPASPERIGPLERIERGRSSNLVMALVFASPFALGALLGVLIILIFAHLPSLADVLFVLILLSIIGGPFVGFTVMAIIKLRHVRKPLTVVADEWGLKWQTPTVRRKREQLAWHEARSFFTIAEPQEDGSSRNSAYVLQGEGHRLAWMMPVRADIATSAASERLARLIVTRTRLPLSDISAAALSPEDYDLKDPALSPVDPPIGPRAGRFLLLAWLIPIALAVLITFTALVLSHLPIPPFSWLTAAAGSVCQISRRCSALCCPCQDTPGVTARPHA